MEILITNSTFNGQIEHKDKRATPDPQENCHLNVKTLPKTCLFFFEKIAKNENFCKFFLKRNVKFLAIL